jgi:hypothetical protein
MTPRDTFLTELSRLDVFWIIGGRTRLTIMSSSYLPWMLINLLRTSLAVVITLSFKDYLIRSAKIYRKIWHSVIFDRNLSRSAQGGEQVRISLIFISISACSFGSVVCIIVLVSSLRLTWWV